MVVPSGIRYFIKQGLAEHKGNAIIPTEEGLAVMWGVVRNYIPDARLSPGDVQEA